MIYDKLKKTRKNIVDKMGMVKNYIPMNYNKDKNDDEISNNAVVKKTNKKLKDKVEEYENNNLQSVSYTFVSRILILIFVIIALIILLLILNISNQVRLFNNHLGYIVLFIGIAAFIFFYIIPIFSIMTLDCFHIINYNNNKQANDKHNKKIRKNIAKRIVNFHTNVNKQNWYDKTQVNTLSDALNDNDDEEITKTLTKLMNTSIKQASDKIIVNASVRAGAYAALSPSPILDAFLVFGVNFRMIKDIIFLYGFRPSELRLVNIFLRVFFNSIASYTLDNMQIGSIVLGQVVSKSVPFIQATSYLADTAVQALANGLLTSCVGYKTIEYMMNEYHLAYVLSNIDVLDDEESFMNTQKQVEEEMQKQMPFLKRKMSNEATV